MPRGRGIEGAQVLPSGGEGIGGTLWGKMSGPPWEGCCFACRCWGAACCCVQPWSWRMEEQGRKLLVPGLKGELLLKRALGEGG